MWNHTYSTAHAHSLHACHRLLHISVCVYTCMQSDQNFSLIHAASVTFAATFCEDYYYEENAERIKEKEIWDMIKPDLEKECSDFQHSFHLLTTKYVLRARRLMNNPTDSSLISKVNIAWDWVRKRETFHTRWDETHVNPQMIVKIGISEFEERLVWLT